MNLLSACRGPAVTEDTMQPRCMNGCNRPVLHGRGRFCIECLSGDCPLPCPALVPTDYLTACSLELAARGSLRNALRAEQADRVWMTVVEEHRGGRQ